jgi:hypothetical protein
LEILGGCKHLLAKGFDAFGEILLARRGFRTRHFAAIAGSRALAR